MKVVSIEHLGFLIKNTKSKTRMNLTVHFELSIEEARLSYNKAH